MSQTGQRATWGPEQTYDTSGGDTTFQQVSSAFVENPDIVIIQNDSDVDVTMSQFGVDDNLTLISSGRLVLDMTDKNPDKTFFTFSKGERWYARSAVGTGLFKISYLYRKE